MKDMTAPYPITIEIPVAWGEMDAFQHVNNSVYFKYFESVRIAYFEKIDFLSVMNQTGIGPILASTQCRYKIPLTYPDTVTVGARISRVEKDRFLMEYSVISHRLKKTAAFGEGMLVTFNYNTNEKTPIPGEIKDRIITLEKTIDPDFSA